MTSSISAVTRADDEPVSAVRLPERVLANDPFAAEREDVAAADDDFFPIHHPPIAPAHQDMIAERRDLVGHRCPSVVVAEHALESRAGGLATDVRRARLRSN